MENFEQEYEALRVDAALDALRSEWSSPTIVASYRASAARMSAGGSSNEGGMSPVPYDYPPPTATTNYYHETPESKYFSPPRSNSRQSAARMYADPVQGIHQYGRPATAGPVIRDLTNNEGHRGKEKRHLYQYEQQGPNLEVPQRVEDRLLQVQQTYEAKRIAAREERERREVKSITNTPTICDKSAKLARHKTPLRMMATPKTAAPDLATSSNATPGGRKSKGATPRINAASQKLKGRGAEAQTQWAQERTERVAQMRKRQERENNEVFTGRPMINPLSRVIAGNKDALDGMEGLNIEDRLLVKEQHHASKLEETRRHKEQQARARSNATAASSMGRSSVVSTTASAESVGSRLFRDAQERDAKREEDVKRQELLDLMDSKTGQMLHHPVLKPEEMDGPASDGGVVVVRPGDRVPGGHHITSRAVHRYDYVPATTLNDLAQAKSTNGESLKASSSTGKPAIGEYSKLLAQMKYAREGVTDVETHQGTVGSDRQHRTTILDRLARPKTPTRQGQDKECRFKPEINSNSARIEALYHTDAIASTHITTAGTSQQHEDPASGGEVKLNRIDMLLERQKQYDAHRERLRAQRVAEEEAQMRPRTPIRVPPGGAAAATQSTTSPGVSFVKRQQVWDAKRRAKLDKQRIARIDEPMEDCTFAPHITSSALPAQPTVKAAELVAVTKPRGYIDLQLPNNNAN